MIIIDPQSDRAVLERIVAQAVERDELDLRPNAEWVVQNLTAEARVRSIVQAWRKSSLPLAAWSSGVSRVDVVTSDEYVGLLLQVHLADGRIVTQEPPVTPARLQELRRNAPCSLTPVMADLLQSAPGISLMPNTSLLPTEFLIRPLARLTYYMKACDPEETSRYGYEAIDRRSHAMEVADIAVEYYVLGKNGTLYYFDEKMVAGLTPCLISLDQLVRIYFENPALLASPYEHELAYFPEAAKSLASRPLTEVPQLGDRTSRLTVLGLVALGVRNCRRGLPESCAIELPEEWNRIIDVLRAIIDASETVCTTGASLSERLIGEFVEQARVCTSLLLSQSDASMKSGTRPVASSYLGHMLGHAVAALAGLTALQNPPNSFMAYESTPVVQNIPANCGAAVWDAEVLLGLDLGGPGTKGSPVPSGFFVRPLWPENGEPPR